MLGAATHKGRFIWPNVGEDIFFALRNEKVVG
jgi:hypothetical protein